MAGHNKWSKIKHRKAAVEKKKTKIWSKVSKAIMVAARHGGGDPAANLSLRYAIDEARYANMPRDTIERAIKKGTGEGDTSTFETIRYEGYGPGGVAVIVDALTDNRTRTITDLRLAFSTHGGNIGANGCVAYMFQPRGQLVVSGEGRSEDEVMEAAIGAGALDAKPPEDAEDPSWLILTEVPDFLSAKETLEKAGYKVSDAQLAMVPDTMVRVGGEQAKTLLELVDAVEDLDDVQKVYTNADIAE